MTIVKQQMAWVVAAAFCLAGVLALHVRLDALQAKAPMYHRFMYLPKGDILKFASLGHQAVIADVLWLQVIQVMGEKNISEEAGRWIYQALDVVTTLDPQFVRAYEVGGLALCTLVVMPNESSALLEKGMKHNPDAWQLPFYLGINHYFEFGDAKKAGEYVSRAARLPGAPSPDRLTAFSARLFASSGEPQAAIEALARLYDQTEDDNLRRVLERRIKEAIVERDLQHIEGVISQYRERFGHMPNQLDDLIGAGFLTSVLQDPFGRAYTYDAESHAVRSSSVSERLQVKMRRRRQ